MQSYELPKIYIVDLTKLLNGIGVFWYKSIPTKPKQGLTKILRSFSFVIILPMPLNLYLKILVVHLLTLIWKIITGQDTTSSSSLILTTLTASTPVPGASFTLAATTAITKPVSSTSMANTIESNNGKKWQKMKSS